MGHHVDGCRHYRSNFQVAGLDSKSLLYSTALALRLSLSSSVSGEFAQACECMLFTIFDISGSRSSRCGGTLADEITHFMRIDDKQCEDLAMSRPS
ncbi:hypothetical protein Pdw03_3262 [Penicillium digitatum]|uniref:Uncharacterized protein n=1 Tax=Penicillium digitatum TaxID=36651 RepID=A0A7T6XG01_PENDI|nr:hypothetical protein Pdw03_3262 [Penicillium digitatum]